MHIFTLSPRELFAVEVLSIIEFLVKEIILFGHVSIYFFVSIDDLILSVVWDLHHYSL